MSDGRMSPSMQYMHQQLVDAHQRVAVLLELAATKDAEIAARDARIAELEKGGGEPKAK